MAEHSLGSIGSGLTGTMNSHYQHAQSAVSTLASRMTVHADWERAAAANYRNADEEAARSFDSIPANGSGPLRTTLSSAPPASGPPTGHAGPTITAAPPAAPPGPHTLTGQDWMGTEYQFTPQDVHSLPLTGPNGEPLGVFFPSDTNRPPRPGMMTDANIAAAANTGSHWEAHSQYRPVTGSGTPADPYVEGPPQPAPWSNSHNTPPVYAFAHGEAVLGKFKVEIKNHGGYQQVELDPQTYAHVLAANRHFQAATHHNPNGQLILGSCSVSGLTNAGAQAAATLHHQHNFPNAVHSSTSIVGLTYDPNNGHVEMTQHPVKSSLGTYPGAWHTHQPPAPPPQQPGPPLPPPTGPLPPLPPPTGPLPPVPHQGQAGQHPGPPTLPPPTGPLPQPPQQSQQPQQQSEWFDSPPPSPQPGQSGWFS